MTDQHHTTAEVTDDALQPVQPIEVQIVGRLIEQDDVEPRQHQRRKSTRAACPPDSSVIRVESGRTAWTSNPSSASTAGNRSSRSAAPVASQ